MRLFRQLFWFLPIFALFSMFLYGRKSDVSKNLEKAPKQEVAKHMQCDSCEKESKSCEPNNQCNSCPEPATQGCNCCDSCDPCDKLCIEPDKTKSYEMGYGICEGDLPKAYNAPARIDICGGIDTFAAGSFIYWEPLMDQNDIGLLETTGAGANTFEIIRLKDEYEPGFKIGLGVFFNNDDWDLRADYTRLHASVSSSFDPSNRTRFYSPWILSEGVILISAINSNIDASWKRELDKVDLALGRSYYLGKRLILRPFIGGSVHWLDQKYSINYTTTARVNIDWDTDSWALGPRAGLNTSWFLYKNFRLFSNLSFNLLFASNKTSATGITGSVTLRALSYKKYIVRDVEELDIGFGWGRYFCQDKWHIDFAASYEVQRYSNVNYMNKYGNMYLVNSGGNAYSNTVKPGDLYYHGLTLTARLDF